MFTCGKDRSCWQYFIALKNSETGKGLYNIRIPIRRYVVVEAVTNEAFSGLFGPFHCRLLPNVMFFWVLNTLFPRPSRVFF